ncbi:mast cell protease 4-like [Menidia menidia]
MFSLDKLLLLHLLTCAQIAHGGVIINGDVAPENSMQYMASVQNFWGHVCGGFLISENFVVTAAHCQMSEPTHVILGTHDLMRNSDMKIKIEKKCIYSKFKGVGEGYDIMLLKLSQSANIGPRVKTIPLPTCQTNVRENQICSVAGWGKIKTVGAIVDKLRMVNVSVLTHQSCEEAWNGLPPNVLCAGAGPGSDKGFCQGDSGGPLVCNGMAVGVVSYNRAENCNYPDVPNVYTDITKYVQWIEDILKTKEC